MFCFPSYAYTSKFNPFTAMFSDTLHSDKIIPYGPGNPHTFLDILHRQPQIGYLTSNGEKLI